MMIKRRTAKPGGVKVPHKTLDVLEATKRQAPGLGLADLPRAVRVPKPTVYRIVATLEARSYLDALKRAATGRGSGFFNWKTRRRSSSC